MSVRSPDTMKMSHDVRRIVPRTALSAGNFDGQGCPSVQLFSKKISCISREFFPQLKIPIDSPYHKYWIKWHPVLQILF
jgi:hypothetical protein